MIVRPATPSGFSPAHRPSGMPSSDRDQHRHERELEGRGHALEDEPQRGHAEHERPAEVAVQRACEETPGIAPTSAGRARAPRSRCSRSCWSACGLIRMSTGLPIAYTPTNTSSDMMNRTSTACMLRRMMKTGMAVLYPSGHDGFPLHYRFPMPLVDDIAGLRRILTRSRTIAVVGLSANWCRPSFFAAKYMQRSWLPHHPRQSAVRRGHGREMLSEPARSSTASAKIDIVDCFRKPRRSCRSPRDAVAIGAKVLWMQLGVRNDEAAKTRSTPGSTW